MKYGCNMTAAQAIKELESIKYGLDRNAPKGSVAELQDRVAREAGLDFAIDVLKERIEFPRPDWTPCAEGLPEESKIYSVIAVYYQNGSIKDVMDNLWYYGNGEWQKYDDLCKVIAWKPYNPDRKEDADHIVDANKKIEED